MYAVGKQMLLFLCLVALAAPVALADGFDEVSMDPARGVAQDVRDMQTVEEEPWLRWAGAMLEPEPRSEDPPRADEGGKSANGHSGSHSHSSSSSSGSGPGSDDGALGAVERHVLSEADAARAQALAEAGVLKRLVGEQVQEVEKIPTDQLPRLIDLPSDEEASTQSTAPKTASASPLPIAAAAVVVTTAAAAGATMVFFWLTGSSATSAGGAYASSKGATAAGKKVVPIFSPLFTRFEGKKVLEHPNREALYTQIATVPGVRLQDLCDATGLSRTAVTHHLRLLENQHLIISKRVGRSRHYYENGGRFARDEKAAYAVLQNERSRAIADYIRSNPGAIQKHLCESLGVRPSIVHWHVKRLKEAQLVDAVRQGRTVSYYPADAMARLSL